MHRGAPQKPDANQKAIVEALRLIPGVSVLIVNGAVDILVGFLRRTYVFEIKNPKGNRKRRTPRQKQLLATWTGHYMVVETLQDILMALGIDKDGVGGDSAHDRPEEK